MSASTPAQPAPAASAIASEADPRAIGAEPLPESSSAGNVWGIVTRSLALGGLLSASLVYFVAYTFTGPWLEAFLRSNALPMDRRMVLIIGGAAGLAVGALATAAVLGVVARRQRGSFAAVERVLWFAFPISLLPLLSLLLSHTAWRGRHAELLQATLLLVLVAEVFVARSIAAAPKATTQLFDALRARVPGFLRRHGMLLLIIAAGVGYTVFMSYYTVQWHFKLKTHHFDLSINDNLLYGGLEGVFMHSTVAHGTNPEEYLATHAKYGAYVFLPIYYFFPRAETLLVIQSASLGLGAIPLFAYARRHVSELAAAVVALAYLAYYPMHSANFYEAKYVPIAVFFVFATVWAAEARRWVWCTLAFLLAVLMREDMPVAMAVIGGFFLITGRRPVAGLLMAVVASAWFALLRFYIMEQAGDWWFPRMYKALWAPGEQGFSSVIKTLVSNPLFVLDNIIEERKVIYLMHLLVPIALLPARRWYLWAAFIPGTIITLLTTDYDPPTGFSFQYVMHWAPLLFLAAPLALSSISRRSDHGPARMRAALTAMLLASLVTSYNYGAFARHEGSFKGGFSTVSFEYSEEEQARYAALRELIAMIPRDASVAATENVGPHVSARRTIYTMRYGPKDAEYILASKRELGLHRTKPTLAKVLKKGEYGVVARKADFALFKRGYDTTGNKALIKDWRL